MYGFKDRSARIQTMKGVIQLERWDQSKDGSGRWVESIAERHTIKAEIETLSGGRSSGLGQTQVNSSKRFRFRYLGFELKGTWHLKFRGKRWTITGIDRESKAYWVITASDQS